MGSAYATSPSSLVRILGSIDRIYDMPPDKTRSHESRTLFAYAYAMVHSQKLVCLWYQENFFSLPGMWHIAIQPGHNVLQLEAHFCLQCVNALRPMFSIWNQPGRVIFDYHKLVCHSRIRNIKYHLREQIPCAYTQPELYHPGLSSLSRVNLCSIHTLILQNGTCSSAHLKT